MSQRGETSEMRNNLEKKRIAIKNELESREKKGTCSLT